MILNIRKVRLQLGLSMDDMAERCGVEKDVWRLYEYGKRYPPSSVLRMLGQMAITRACERSVVIAGARAYMAGLDGDGLDDADLRSMVGGLLGLLDMYGAVTRVSPGALAASDELTAAAAGLSGDGVDFSRANVDANLEAALVLQYLMRLAGGG